MTNVDNRLGPVYDPLDPQFGAAGDGVADDRSALVAAHLAAAATGGHVELRAGRTFKVVPTSGVSIPVYSNTATVGAGTIVVAEGVSGYRSLFGPADPNNTVLTNYSMADICIDQSGDVNDFETFSPTTARFVFEAYKGSRIAFERVRFANLNNVNTLLFDHTGSGANPALRDVTVRDCDFDDIGGTLLHDHSTIYAYCEGATVTGNRITGRGTGSAVCGIETHGGDMVVAGNRIRDMRIPITITGIAYSAEGIKVADNIAIGGACGISIVSAYHDGNTTNPPIRDLSITDNVIRCDIDAWAGSGMAGIAHGIGSLGNSAPIDGLTIRGNTVVATTNAATDEDLVGVPSVGVGLVRFVDGTNADRRVRIEANDIVGWPSSGVWLQTWLNRGLIAENMIHECGGSQVASSYRAGLFVTGTVTDVRARRNMVTSDVVRTVFGVQWLPDAETRSGHEDNDVYLTT